MRQHVADDLMCRFMVFSLAKYFSTDNHHHSLDYQILLVMDGERANFKIFSDRLHSGRVNV